MRNKWVTVVVFGLLAVALGTLDFSLAPEDQYGEPLTIRPGDEKTRSLVLKHIQSKIAEIKNLQDIWQIPDEEVGLHEQNAQKPGCAEKNPESMPMGDYRMVWL